MGWNSTTKIMTAPLNLDTGGDVQQATVCQSGDLGTCIQQGTINKWAKWKPERNSKIAALTLDDRKENNFGLNITKFTDISSLRAGYGNQWAYIAPRGMAYGERFRMYDFLNTTIANSGYNGQAKCFFRRSASTFPTSYVIGTGGLSFIAQWETESQLDSSYPGSIKRSEIRVNPANELSATLADAYFGVIMYHPNWSGIKIKTASSAVGTSSATSTVSFSDSELQNFPSGVEVYPILSVNQITTISSTFPSAGVFALPMSPFTLDVQSAETSVQIVPDIQATYQRARLNLSGQIGMVTNGVITTLTGVAYNVYAASSLTDKTGAQIGATQTYSSSLTASSPLMVDNSINTSNPDYIRIVIVAYAGQTEITKDFNIQVSSDMPLIT